MSKEDIRKTIDKVIVNTFRSMRMPTTDNLAVTNDDTIRIRYPRRYNKDRSAGEIRISEQELKQVFIYYLLQETTFWFSVETPTAKRYLFKGGKPEENENNQSALVDLSVYESKEAEKPYAHIEFKYGNPDADSFQKDILKLYNEDIELGFFVLVLKSDKQSTWKNLCNKKFMVDIEQFKSRRHEVALYIYSLGSGLFFRCEDLKGFVGETFVPQELPTEENQLTYEDLNIVADTPLTKEFSKYMERFGHCGYIKDTFYTENGQSDDHKAQEYLREIVETGLDWKLFDQFSFSPFRGMPGLPPLEPWAQSKLLNTDSTPVVRFKCQDDKSNMLFQLVLTIDNVSPQILSADYSIRDEVIKDCQQWVRDHYSMLIALWNNIISTNEAFEEYEKHFASL